MYECLNYALNTWGQDESQKSNNPNKIIQLEKDLENLQCKHDFEHEVKSMSN